VYNVPTPARRAWWFPAMALAIVLVLTWTPVVAAGVNAAGAQNAPSTTPSTSLANLAEPPSASDKVDSSGETADGFDAALPKKPAPLPVVVVAPSENDDSSRASRSSDRPASGSQTTANPARPIATAVSSSSPQSTSSSESEESRAHSILAGLIAQHPILAGTTVSIGKTPGGYQAVAYFKSGRIVVSPGHSASLERILRHEIWHVIDWRDNGHIDWGESVPPK
jgi:hypothetical protein